ncbi:hypothetical protein QRD89_14370 [Halobacillus sp. ACCC02827]|uniref:hypothetical protein n=1 Tax=Bacillaceae TaxID=186817 RepID=UPI0002A4ECB9|nr:MULTISPECIES: hypothetical protein [Bacillaceae]ELK47085.1 hypothetical protein D479_08141 [Halobacillus sp. BAB-2008]QHT47656.1 hypothetical protein M662_14575 [Bacillus sp. SB49]WJE14894.1 hypothetical protein QRD89_14370 [Halobacillus sp. ACCC02827]
MNVLAGIGLGLLTIIWLSMEIASVSDEGGGFRSYFRALRGSLLFVIPLFSLAGFIYYGFFN